MYNEIDYGIGIADGDGSVIFANTRFAIIRRDSGNVTLSTPVLAV